MRKTFTITRTQIGRTDNAKTVFVAVKPLAREVKAKLLELLDDWYGNTDQDVETWAVEYQLWARNLLMRAPFLMVNPQFLDLNPVLSQLEVLLGCDNWDTYHAAYESLHEIQTAADAGDSEDGDIISVAIHDKLPGDWIETDPDSAQWCRRFSENMFELIQAVELPNTFAVAHAILYLGNYTAEEKERILASYDYDSWADLVSKSGSEDNAKQLFAECAFETEALRLINENDYDTFEAAEAYIKNFVKAE